MDRGAWQATVHGVPKNQTRLEALSTQAHILQKDPPFSSDVKGTHETQKVTVPWSRVSRTLSSNLVRNRTLGPPLENNPEIPPSSRDEGLRLLHGLAGEVSRGSSGEYQADEQAGVARLSWPLSGR